MRTIVYYIAWTFVSLLQTLMLFAQAGHGRAGHGPAAGTQPPAVVKATVDKQKILIGEPIQLMLEVTVPGAAQLPGGPVVALPAGGALSWPALDSLPHFEWVEKGKVDSVVRGDGRYYRQYLTVTSFDSGAWAIPRLPFIAGNRKYFSDSIRIEVGYTKIDPSKDYHDIKDIIDVPNPFAKWIGWIVAAVTLASLALVVWLIRKKKTWKAGDVTAPVVRLSPYEEAIRQLEELERQHLPENGSMKVYYTRLSDILRVFLFRRLHISSLSETSEELIGQLRRLPVASGNFAELAETLRMSDFVKFAKYEPGISDSEEHFRAIRGAIEGMEKTIGQEEKETAVRNGLAKAGGERPGETNQEIKQ